MVRDSLPEPQNAEERDWFSLYSTAPHFANLHAQMWRMVLHNPQSSVYHYD